MKAAAAWALYLVAIACVTTPYVFFTGRAYDGEKQRAREVVTRERADVAEKLRLGLELAFHESEEVLGRLPADLPMDQVGVVLTSSRPHLTTATALDASGSLMLPHPDGTARPLALARMLETKAATRPVWLNVRLQARDAKEVVVLGAGEYIWISRVLASGIEVGFLVDLTSVEADLDASLRDRNLRLERVDDGGHEPSPKESSSRRPSSSMMRLLRSSLNVTVTRAAISPKAIVEVVSRDPARDERMVRQRGLEIVLNAVLVLALFLGLSTFLFVRTRRAQRLADLRTDFVASVSHELRTPLASVRMFAELLEANVVAPGERREVEEGLASEARRLHGTLEKMLRFGALARGKLKAVRTRTAVRPILEDAAARIAPRHAAVVDMDASIEADVDAALLGLALDNLLGNAAKYAPEGGPIQLRARMNRADVVIDVIDEGPGLEPRARRRVFEAFVRGDTRLSRATEGTGVGLALVRGIARAHGGEATVTSKPGAGATFTLRLPTVAP